MLQLLELIMETTKRVSEAGEAYFPEDTGNGYYLERGGNRYYPEDLVDLYDGKVYEVSTDDVINASLAGPELVTLTDTSTSVSYRSYYANPISGEQHTTGDLYRCVITPLYDNGSETITGSHASVGSMGMFHDPVELYMVADSPLNFQDFDRLDYRELQTEVGNVFKTIQEKLNEVSNGVDPNPTIFQREAVNYKWPIHFTEMVWNTEIELAGIEFEEGEMETIRGYPL